MQVIDWSEPPAQRDDFGECIQLARANFEAASVHATAMSGVRSRKLRRHAEWYTGFLLEMGRVFMGAAVRSANLSEDTRQQLESLWGSVSHTEHWRENL